MNSFIISRTNIRLMQTNRNHKVGNLIYLIHLYFSGYNNLLDIYIHIYIYSWYRHLPNKSYLNLELTLKETKKLHGTNVEVLLHSQNCFSSGNCLLYVGVVLVSYITWNQFFSRITFLCRIHTCSSKTNSQASGVMLW